METTMSNRDYNKVWTLGPLVLQVIQDGQHDGISVDLLPRVCVAVNNSMIYFGLGFEWLTGGFNIGWAKPSYLAAGVRDQKLYEEQATKQGLTVKQYRLRWGW
jgi:hypothetical protein